mgnify:CR=1 FL=1
MMMWSLRNARLKGIASIPHDKIWNRVCKNRFRWFQTDNFSGIQKPWEPNCAQTPQNWLGKPSRIGNRISVSIQFTVILAQRNSITFRNVSETLRFGSELANHPRSRQNARESRNHRFSEDFWLLFLAKSRCQKKLDRTTAIKINPK